jgi:SAM-dependent methyltransferase
MTATSANKPYVLGTTDAEHDRLLRQAARLEPFTERLFRDAGIGPGQRVLDVGSGVGDVAFLVARLVGPAGEVIGIDLDGTALDKARARASQIGLRNVRFVESEVYAIPAGPPFDAVVGRLILQFLPDPADALRSLATKVKPGGVVVFHEANWASFLSQAAHLPLRSLCGSLIIETFRRSGAKTDMELTLFRALLGTGFSPADLRLETPIGNDPETRRWVYDLFCTVSKRFDEFGMSASAVGDMDTLFQRLETELDSTQSYAACIGLVGAWARKPLA